jgi:uncharacterized protein (DUF983 family)
MCGARALSPKAGASADVNPAAPEKSSAPVSRVALLGRCPACGDGRLFDGYLKVAKSCRRCGLDFAPFQAGDGPAAFVILIVGFLVAGGALLVEVSYAPPYWVHAVIWGPTILVLSLGLLRLLKGGLIAMQFKHKAEEGRLQ